MKRYLFIFALAALALVSCGKEKISTKSDSTNVVTGDSQITSSNVTLQGRVRSNLLEGLQAAGFVLSRTSGNYSSPKEFVSSNMEEADYSVTLSIDDDLDGKRGVRWYYKAFAELDSGRQFGKERTFLIDPIHVTGVSLSPSTEQHSLKVGESVNVLVTVSPAKASDKSFTVISSDTAVASVESAAVDGNPAIKITAKSVGNTTVTVTTNDGEYTASCKVKVRSASAPSGSVDLGLSVYWAKYNLNSTSNYGLGSIYQWGNTTPANKDQLDKDHSAIWDTSTNYWVERYKIAPCYLQQQDDAAYQTKGSPWRVPSLEELKELVDKCTFSSVSNGTGWSTSNLNSPARGIKFTSKINGSSIIIPVDYYTYKVVATSPYVQWKVCFMMCLWSAETNTSHYAGYYKIELEQTRDIDDGYLRTENIYKTQYWGNPITSGYYFRPVAD